MLRVEDSQSSSSIRAYLQPKKRRDAISGITVLDETSVKLIGSVDAVEFTLDPSITINKFSLMQVGLSRANDVSELKICLIESIRVGVVGIPRFICFTTGFIDVDEEVGEMFVAKGASPVGIEIGKIVLSQKANSVKSSVLERISFVSSPESSFFDFDGTCMDPNSVTIEPFVSCMCNDGYVSSSGGVSLNLGESCVSCLVSDYCFFEGQACQSESECYSRDCADGVCKANVSLGSYYCTVLVYYINPSCSNALWMYSPCVM